MGGKDIVISEEAALLNGQYADRESFMCTIQHELMHNLGLSHETNSCSSNDCVMQGVRGMWCGNCSDIIRAYIAEEGVS